MSIFNSVSTLYDIHLQCLTWNHVYIWLMLTPYGTNHCFEQLLLCDFPSFASLTKILNFYFYKLLLIFKMLYRYLIYFYYFRRFWIFINFIPFQWLAEKWVKVWFLTFVSVETLFIHIFLFQCSLWNLDDHIVDNGKKDLCILIKKTTVQKRK